MYKYFIFVGVALIAFGCVSKQEKSAQPQTSPPNQVSKRAVKSEKTALFKDDLPNHRVASNTSLAPKDGKRIEIHVNDPQLSKEDCIKLVEHYRKAAGSQGQVSVRKPSKLMGGTMQPWAVDNMDGNGITFNDYYFE